MPRRETIAYATIPRNKSTERLLFEYQQAKNPPKYVHGRPGMSKLLHKVSRVDLSWWEHGWDVIYRLVHPRMFAITNCGMTFFIEAGKCVTCEHPKPDSVLCGLCHGTGRNFPRGKKHDPTMRQAADRLGCSEHGECKTEAWDGVQYRG